MDYDNLEKQYQLVKHKSLSEFESDLQLAEKEFLEFMSKAASTMDGKSLSLEFARIKAQLQFCQYCIISKNEELK